MQILAFVLLLLSSPSFADPIVPVGSAGINNSGAPQNAQFNVGSGTVRGLLKADRVLASSITTSTLTVTYFYGSALSMTNLNATQLLTGTVPGGRMSGSYPGIIGLGVISSGTWNGGIVAPQYGGTGRNWSAAATGGIPIFVNVGSMSVIPIGQNRTVLQSTGTGVLWTSSPSISGLYVSSIPLTNLSTGTLPGLVTITDTSISSVAAAKVIGDIAGNAAGLSIPLILTNLKAGTLPLTVVASSVADSGVLAGTYGAYPYVPRIVVGYDGRITSASYRTSVVAASSVTAGALQAGVTIGASQIASGTLPTTVPASSITVTGVIPGQYATASKISTFTVREDGRLSSAGQMLIAIEPYQVNAGTFPGQVMMYSTSIVPGTLPLSVPASSITATGVSSATYGNSGTTLQMAVRTDGRIWGIKEIAIPGFSTSTALTDIDNSWIAPQTFYSSVTVNGGFSASAIYGDPTSFNVNIQGLPSIDTNSGGDIAVAGGTSEAGAGGSLDLEGGASNATDGGAVVISGGTGPTSGGLVLITGGDSPDSTGGDVVLNSGAGISSIIMKVAGTERVRIDQTGNMWVGYGVVAASFTATGTPGFVGDGSLLTNLPTSSFNTRFDQVAVDTTTLEAEIQSALSPVSITDRLDLLAISTTVTTANLNNEIRRSTQADAEVRVSTVALEASKVNRSGDSMTGQLTISGSSLTVRYGILADSATFTNWIIASSGVFITSVTAGYFVGNGSALTGVVASGAVAKTGDTMSGQLTNTSTVTITGADAASYGLRISSGIYAYNVTVTSAVIGGVHFKESTIEADNQIIMKSATGGVGSAVSYPAKISIRPGGYFGYPYDGGDLLLESGDSFYNKTKGATILLSGAQPTQADSSITGGTVYSGYEATLKGGDLTLSGGNGGAQIRLAGRVSPSLGTTTLYGPNILNSSSTFNGPISVQNSTVSITGFDSNGYSLALSSGINMPNGTIVANRFLGDGSGLTGLPGASPNFGFFTANNGTAGVGTFSIGYVHSVVQISSISVVIAAAGSGGSSGTKWSCCYGGECVSITSTAGAAAGSAFTGRGSVAVNANGQLVLMMESTDEIVTPTVNATCGYQQ